MRNTMKKNLYVILVIFFNVCLFQISQAQSSPDLFLIDDYNYKTFYRIARSPVNKMNKFAAWERAAPEVKTVSIKSTLDNTEQKALFYNSGSKRKKPLLLALHSWSEDYTQHFSIPYGIFAIKNDWVLIHPDYRGAFTNPMSTLSEYAVADILDALEYARKNADIDQSRIYITGFSGGGMATLVMAGRYPHLFSAAAAWVPVYDLVQWYGTTRYAKHNYSRHITNSCGGAPIAGSKAHAECLKRSVSSYLKNARGTDLPVYIATGVKDGFVPPSHSIQAFNDLANQTDRISPEDIRYIDKKRSLPAHLKGDFFDSLFTDAGLRLIFERKSDKVILKIFDGKHDVIYNAGLYWLSTQKRKTR